MKFFACLLMLCLAIHAQAAETFPPLVYACEGEGKILRFDTKGEIAWEYPAAMARDVWQLPSGNVLFCYNDQYNSKQHNNPSGVMEVTPDKKIVFHYRTTGQVWSCQRLADGTTMVGAASQGKLLIVDNAGKLVREIQLINKPGHSCIRNARQIANGNFLVAEESSSTAREYSPDGKLLREIKVPFRVYSVVRLPNGNTLICGQQHIAEIDPADTEAWSFDGKEYPQLGIRWLAGMQVLPNGRLFMSNAGGTVTFFELDRDKKIVWQSGHFKAGHGIQRLDVPGPALK